MHSILKFTSNTCSRPLKSFRFAHNLNYVKFIGNILLHFLKVINIIIIKNNKNRPINNKIELSKSKRQTWTYF